MSSLMTEVLCKLKSENQRLENELIFINKCLNVLFEFKNSLLEILNSRTSSEIICLTSEDIHYFKDIDEEYNRVLAEKAVKSESNEKLFEIQNEPKIDKNIESNEDLNNHKITEINKKYSEMKRFINKGKKTTHFPSNVISISFNSSTVSEQMITKNVSPIISQKEKLSQISNKLNDNYCETVVNTDNQTLSKTMNLISIPNTVIPTVILPKISENNKKIDNNCETLVMNEHNYVQPFEAINNKISQINEKREELTKVRTLRKILPKPSNPMVLPINSVINGQLSTAQYNSMVVLNVQNCQNNDRLISDSNITFCDINANEFDLKENNDKLNSRLLQISEESNSDSNINENNFKCPVIGCDFECRIKSHLWPHQRDCHKDYKPVKCKICGKCFSSKRYVWRHYRNNHGQRLYKCDFDGCQQTFKVMQTLLTHQRVHKNERPFKCDLNQCKYRAKSKAILNIHKRFTHSNERPFICKINECLAKFKSKAQINTHIKYIHSGLNNRLKCDFKGCDKEFRFISDLNIHKKCHLTHDISCDWSGSEYITNTGIKLSNHKKSHSNERKYVCVWPECGKAFKSGKSLKEHHRIHTNEKPYACEWPGCEYRCATYSNLLIHKRVHNKNFSFIHSKYNFKY